jgi:hypothetical protein
MDLLWKLHCLNWFNTPTYLTINNEFNSMKVHNKFVTWGGQLDELWEPQFMRKIRQQPCLYLSSQTYGSNTSHWLKKMQSSLFVSLLKNPQDSLPVISTTLFVINCYFCLQAICASSSGKILRPHVDSLAALWLVHSFIHSFIYSCCFLSYNSSTSVRYSVSISSILLTL